MSGEAHGFEAITFCARRCLQGECGGALHTYCPPKMNEAWDDATGPPCIFWCNSHRHSGPGRFSREGRVKWAEKTVGMWKKDLEKQGWEVVDDVPRRIVRDAGGSDSDGGGPSNEQQRSTRTATTTVTRDLVRRCWSSPGSSRQPLRERRGARVE